MKTMNPAQPAFSWMLSVFIADYFTSFARAYSANDIEAAIAGSGNPAGG